MRNVKIYTKDYCPYCNDVKKYLSDNRINFENISVDNNEKLFKQLKEKTNHGTVPLVFIDGEFIGGASDFFKLVG